MTIATELGFVVGNRYKVITNGDMDADYGDVLTFIEDNGTFVPFFKNKNGWKFQMHLDDLEPYNDLPSEILPESDSSLEVLIALRDKAQKALDGKLKSLGLQGIAVNTFPQATGDFEWEESDWREFEVGDEIKVDESNIAGGRNIFFGKVVLKKNPQCCGHEGYPLFVKNNDTQRKKWIEFHSFMYKKVYR